MNLRINLRVDLEMNQTVDLGMNPQLDPRAAAQKQSWLKSGEPLVLARDLERSRLVGRYEG